MGLLPLLLAPLYIIGALSSPFDVPSGHITVRQNGIVWAACPGGQDLECAQFQVPLDYKNPSVGNARLAMIRSKATATPRLGTLFAYGGFQGTSGIGFVSSAAQILHGITGGHFDLVGWDPRGVNNSQPVINCFDTQAASEQMITRVHDIRIEAGRTFTDQDAQNLYAQETSIDQTLSSMYQTCVRKEGDNLRYVGTVATARDIVSMADALDGPTSAINFIGHSFGTVIGAYLVNMYPNRVGRVVLDGVYPLNVYSVQPSHLGPARYIPNAETTLEGYFQSCAAAGSRCAIAKGGNATQVKEYMLDLLDGVYQAYPLGFPVSSRDAREISYSYMYNPLAWDEFAASALELEAGLAEASQTGTGQNNKREIFKTTDLNQRDKIWRSSLNKRQQANNTFIEWASMFAITCGDSVDPGSTSTRNVLEEIVRLSQNVSPMFGPVFTWWVEYFCHRWGSRAVERYTGPWNAILANPILIIGNTADPAAPLDSPKFLADQLGSSAVFVTLNSYGHTSFAIPSPCILNLTADYLVTGKLPSAGTTCSTEAQLFTNTTSPL